MMDLTELGMGEGRVYRPGELVDPGRYRRLDHQRSVIIEGHADYLPPSFDGTIALYTRIETAADLLMSGVPLT